MSDQPLSMSDETQWSPVFARDGQCRHQNLANPQQRHIDTAEQHPKQHDDKDHHHDHASNHSERRGKWQLRDGPEDQSKDQGQDEDREQ